MVLDDGIIYEYSNIIGLSVKDGNVLSGMQASMELNGLGSVRRER